MPAELRSLADWLAWQETLNPAEIELGLERVGAVAQRLKLTPNSPNKSVKVFTVAGTNGKGSTVAVLEAVLRACGLRTGVYTSPHLHRYNERITVAGNPASDAEIIQSFERIDAAREGLPLTYFEFGTLAALDVFRTRQCDVWILEVGLGGRLDAVNVIDADFALITTIALDHQSWLGDSIEAIAAEKAGILRAGQAAFFGAPDVPTNVAGRAAELGLDLHYPGHGYTWQIDSSGHTWSWQGTELNLEQLPASPERSIQVQNQALALAAIEAFNPGLLEQLAHEDRLTDVLVAVAPPGRFQRYVDAHEWVLDVAHNPQAAVALAQSLGALPSRPATLIIGLLADKDSENIGRALAGLADNWIVTASGGARARDSGELAQELSAVCGCAPLVCEAIEDAVATAREITPAGGRIIVCGSFTVVGPVLALLGLY